MKSVFCYSLFVVIWTNSQGDNGFNQRKNYTDVQPFNPFCDLPKVRNVNITKIVCNFNNTAASLGDLTNFLNNDNSKGKKEEIHIEINNCSDLVIQLTFHSWRDNFSSLYLTVENTESVEQEENVDLRGREQDILTRSDFISFTLRRSRMNRILPSLISDTKALIIDVEESQVETISEYSFRNVSTLWQLRIIKSSISRIASRAMPEVLSISPPPSDVLVKWTPFIFNETHIKSLDSHALHLRITEKEYFNIINSRFFDIQSGGLSISGAGHFVVADSIFNRVQKDSIVVRLKRNETGKVQKLMDFPTLTLMGVEISAVNITNFLLNLQIENGKLFLIRIAFQFPDALSSIISLDNNSTVFSVWDLNYQTTYVERWSVICSCQEIVDSFTDEQIQNSRDESSDGIQAATMNEMRNETYDYEDFKQVEATVTAASSLRKTIWKELRCFQNGTMTMSLLEFQLLLCSSWNGEDELNATISQHIPTHNHYPSLFAWYIGTGGMCFVISALIAASACLYKTQKRRTFNICQRNKTTVHRPNKQVGVISEDPICVCEDEEESTL